MPERKVFITPPEKPFDRDAWSKKKVEDDRIESEEYRQEQQRQADEQESDDSNAIDPSNHFKNDVGYADAIVQRHAKSIRYCSDEKIWLVFDEAAGWQRDETGTKIRSMAADYARELYQTALIAAAKKEPDIEKRIIASAAARETESGLNQPCFLPPAIPPWSCGRNSSTPTRF